MSALAGESADAGRALRRELVTPEGIALPIELAGASDRLVAFILDALLIGALLLAVVIGFAVTGGSALGAPLVLAAFALTHFYFTWFELRWQGRTPGKRFTDLRVVDRHGGRLSAAAIFARNVTREVELVFPLVLLADPGALVHDAPPAIAFAATAWLLALGFFPLCNRDRLRLGDLVAGTLVVHAPKRVLLRDLSQAAPRAAAHADAPAPGHAFTAEQLAIYGIYEVQVLEEVLRRERPDRAAALALIAERVARKVGYADAIGDPGAFLADFYAAQRARLEARLLLGDRKERKSS